MKSPPVEVARGDKVTFSGFPVAPALVANSHPPLKVVGTRDWMSGEHEMTLLIL
jgi:hypothetical protein